MDLGLSGKVAMVAAASKGIGRACAEALATEGCRVSICARATAKVAAAAMSCTVDVASPADLERWYHETETRLGAVDVLVTNTGSVAHGRPSTLPDELWTRSVEAMLLSVVRLSRAVTPGMRARRWGRIVHMTSFVAKEPSDERTISSTLRAGLSALTKAMAAELGPDGITVNAVLPGFVKTPAMAGVAVATDAIPLRRMAEAREIGEVVAFLCSERASYLTGASLSIDGGLTRSLF